MLHNLNLLFRQALPALLILLISFLGLIVNNLWNEISPWFTLIAIWFWALYRSDLTPVWFIFLIGLLSDFYSGNIPYGTHSAVLVFGYLILIPQRRFIISQSFIMQWLLFAIFAALSYFLRFAIVFFFTFSGYSYKENFLSFFIITMCYPFFYRFFSLCYNFVSSYDPIDPL